MRAGRQAPSDLTFLSPVSPNATTLYVDVLQLVLRRGLSLTLLGTARAAADRFGCDAGRWELWAAAGTGQSGAGRLHHRALRSGRRRVGPAIRRVSRLAL